MLQTDSYLQPVDMDTSIMISVVVLTLFLFGEAFGKDVPVTSLNMEKRVAELEALTEKQKAVMDKLFSALMDKSEVFIQKTTGRNVKEADIEDIVTSLTIEDLRTILTGRDGADGMPGRYGHPGAQGLPGSAGQPGSAGPPGTAGQPGRDGRDGDDGDDGKDGVDGRAGSSGPTGSPGISGKPGNSSQGPPGTSGFPGVAGLPGAPGSAGSQGLPGHPVTPANLSAIGSVYTRWGRTSCAEEAVLIYKGFAAGGSHVNPGGGVNYQCMPLNPDQSPYRGGSAYIYGAEYQSHATGGSFTSSAQHQNVPCVRCLSPRSAVMMLPGKNRCPSGWYEEYDGYLMSDHHTHAHPSTFECVDDAPEYVPGMGADENGALFYMIRAYCGSQGRLGHCPPYSSSSHPLTCVVCTK